MQLHEKHRPTTLDDVAGHDKPVAILKKMLASPHWDRDAIWIQGPSGTGKTTLANILASARCDDRDIKHVAGVDCTVEEVEQIKYESCLGTWGESGWKAFIIDEANAMSPRAVQAWKTLLEPLKPRRLYLFTSARTIDTLFETGAENSQLASRCKVFTLQPQAGAFAAHVQKIAEAEGLAGAPPAAYARLLKDCAFNLRAALQKIEAGELFIPEVPAMEPVPDIGESAARLLARCKALTEV